MKAILILQLTICFALQAFSQEKAYTDSIARYRKIYVRTHDVVKGEDQKYFRFFPANKKFLVEARFEKISDSTGFTMKSTGKIKSRYYKYGYIYFNIDNKPQRLTVYQNERLLKTSQYKDNLFVPFTDRNSGIKAYGGGRYIDFNITDISNNTVMIDFNKAYNPYCAYASGYNCPIPPKENTLHIEVDAGEMAFGKTH